MVAGVGRPPWSSVPRYARPILARTITNARISYPCPCVQGTALCAKLDVAVRNKLPLGRTHLNINQPTPLVPYPASGTRDLGPSLNPQTVQLIAASSTAPMQFTSATLLRRVHDRIFKTSSNFNFCTLVEIGKYP